MHEVRSLDSGELSADAEGGGVPAGLRPAGDHRRGRPSRRANAATWLKGVGRRRRSPVLAVSMIEERNGDPKGWRNEERGGAAQC